jgi:hypothetical protein
VEEECRGEGEIGEDGDKDSMEEEDWRDDDDFKIDFLGDNSDFLRPFLSSNREVEDGEVDGESEVLL